MGEIRQANFRINQETADAFRRFCEEQGMSQAQGFDHIMQVVELDRAKIMTPGRQTEIESFEKLIKDLLAAYLNSLELGNRAAGLAREQFAAELEQKSETIRGLQEKIAEHQVERDAWAEERKELRAEAASAERGAKAARDQLADARKAAADKEQVCAIQADQIAGLRQQLSEMGGNLSDLKKQLEEAKKAREELAEELKGQEKRYEAAMQSLRDDHEAEMRSLKDGHEAEMNTLRERLSEAESASARMQQTLDLEKASFAAKLEQQQLKAALDLEKAVIAKEREMQERIIVAEREAAMLKGRHERQGQNGQQETKG